MSYDIHAAFLKEAKTFFRDFPEITAKAASMSLNQVAERDGLAMMRAKMEAQIAFPSGYLKQSSRFGIASKASPENLEVIIRARDRATSLARFAPGYTPESNRGKPIVVQVKQGRTRTLRRAFLVRLKNDNIGLAVRLKPGETLNNKTQGTSVELANNVYLLYGPSVDQAFKSVAAESLPELNEKTLNEFFRQFARLSKLK